ncbi:MAG: hypothetical protein GQ546_05535 [Gammaproteobacteria bacterium]|nr:hypothetical protein [Gammaproteobacteria bacterium]
MNVNIKKYMLVCISIFITITTSQSFAKNYHIKWKERDGKILLNTVCYNQTGRFDKIPCKNQAKEHFTKICKKTGQKKFCDASRYFNPNAHGTLSGASY